EGILRSRVPHAKRGPCPHEDRNTRTRLGLELRGQFERHRRVHPLFARQDRHPVRDRADTNRARRRVHDRRTVNLPVRVRLTLWYSAVLLVILGVVGVFLVARLRAGLVRGVDDDLAARSQVVAQGVRPGPRLPSLGLQEIVAQLVAGDGRVLSVAGESVPSYPLLQGPGRGVEHFAGADYRVLGTRLPG